MAHGTISVSAPASGATWDKGTSYSIQWSVAGNQLTWNYFNLYLYSDTDGLVDTITTSLAGAYRSYSYTPDTSLDTASDYYILITGNYDHDSGGDP